MPTNLLKKIGLLLAFSVALVACNEQGDEGAKPESKSTPVNAETTALEKTKVANEHLSASAQQGKQAFAACNACHNPELDPPLAPPMYGVKKYYT